MMEVPSKEDYDRLSKAIAEMMSEIQTKHNGLLELAKSTSSALGKMREELDQMPSGYRNSQDIKNLRARIERCEAREYHIDANRIAELEAALKSNRELHMEHAKAHRESMGQIQDDLTHQLKEMRECCKNTVASEMALEEKVDYVMNNGLGKTEIKAIVRDILKSL